MSPLYLFNGKLLVKNSKLATNAGCCCSTFVCKSTRCGCIEHQYSDTYTKLWSDIQEWINSEEYTCNNNPVNCGQWKPKLINGVPQRNCCSQACYDIWEHILGHVGYDQETIDSKSPAELDVLCSSIMIAPTFFPTDKNNPNTDLFDGISYNDRYHVTILDTKHKAGELGSPCLPDLTEILCDDLSLQPVTFAILTGDGTLTANIDSNALDLLKTGTCLPHEKTTNYTNVNDCRNCYGALFKLGTYDSFGRIDANPDFMTSILINANGGDLKSTTDFSFSTSSKLTPTDCITKKFPGTDPINPYGILTSQLASSPTMVNGTSETPNYFEFDLRYKYEISWDNTNWYAATNKWTVKYGPQPSNNPSFSFENDINNYYQNNIPQPISASISSLDFDPVTISTKISVNWGDNGILIGNSDCSFSNTKLSKIGETRSIPSLTVSSENSGTDCTFTPVLQQLSEPNGAPYWTISSVGLVCNDENYTIGESLKVTIGNGDIEEIKAELKITSGGRVSPTLTISGGGGDGNAVFVPTLSSTGSPAVWSLSGGSASGGSGYVTGTSLSITTNPEDITIIPAKATVLARGEPSITASAPNGNGAALSVQLSQAGSPPVWSVSKVDVTNGGTNYTNYSNLIFTTSDNIETNASAILLTTSLSPVLSIGAYIGNGAQFQININGPYVAAGNCISPDYYDIDIVILNGGNGYPNTDGLTLILDADTVVRGGGGNEYSGLELPLFYSVDINGTIISIDGLMDPDTFEMLPVGIFSFYKPSGIIKCIRITNGGQYYSNTGAAYGISVIDGGQYYKPGNPVVEVVNGGKYYHTEAPYVRAVSGPCINDIKMDTWHPGPCGISSELITETSMNTSWQKISGSDGRISNTVFSSQSATLTPNLVNKYLLIYNGLKYIKYKVIEYLTSTSLKIEVIAGGSPLLDQTQDREYYIDGYYYGDLIQNVYRKFWRWNNDGGSYLFGDCPCCKPVDLMLGVVKQEGCENFTIANNYDIPLEQWEIDFNFCDILTVDPNVYKRYCFSDYNRYNCCSAFDYGCGGNPTDYRYDGYPCVPGSPEPPSEQCPPRSPGIPFQNGGFVLASGIITCEDMTPGQFPNFYPDNWQNCPVITKENAPWKKTDINCP